MTGAVLPAGTDLVIPYEQCDIHAGIATVRSAEAIARQHVHARGTDGKKGDLLIKRGATVTPAMVGMMASVGLAVVEVRRFPSITICSTGDELVDIQEQPEAHQVRRSNAYMLAAALLAEGVHPTIIHLPDEPAQMAKEIAALLPSNDAILFSGAVSKGKYDFLPPVLSEAGMETIFHTVAQRPGKPFLFGKFAGGPLIFGFPGNPVSTFACYHQFFKRWLHQSVQVKNAAYAQLAEDVHFKPALSYHLLVKLQNLKGTFVASPVVGSTSGDLVTLIKADGIITLPAERDFFRKGELFEVNLLH
jgi:molybdopterin molybdotransferase